MTQPRISEAGDIVKAGQCCHAKKVIDIAQKRVKTLRKSKTDESYWEAFWLGNYIKIIDHPSKRERLGDKKVSYVIDRINQMCC